MIFPVISIVVFKILGENSSFIREKQFFALFFILLPIFSLSLCLIRALRA